MTHGNFVFYNPVKILFGKAQIANIIAVTSVDAQKNISLPRVEVASKLTVFITG